MSKKILYSGKILKIKKNDTHLNDTYSTIKYNGQVCNKETQSEQTAVTYQILQISGQLPEKILTVNRKLPEKILTVNRKLPEKILTVNRKLPEKKLTVNRKLPEKILTVNRKLPETILTVNRKLPRVFQSCVLLPHPEFAHF
jgi:hypothetical protein